MNTLAKQGEAFGRTVDEAAYAKVGTYFQKSCVGRLTKRGAARSHMV